MFDGRFPELMSVPLWRRAIVTRASALEVRLREPRLAVDLGGGYWCDDIGQLWLNAGQWKSIGERLMCGQPGYGQPLCRRMFDASGQREQ